MENKYKITVFTPTYNRANLLPRLYDSLVKQTEKDFEWVVVDDGSEDNTEELIYSYINEKKMDIVYHKQTNKGKHKAINKGLDLAKGKWFFIVDSDDYLIDDAINIITKYIQEHQNRGYIGFVFRKAYDKKNRIGNAFPNNKEKFDSNIIERTVKYKVQGDMAEVFRTDILRKCKFDEDINEKFCAEGLMWNRTTKFNSKLLYVDVIIYIAEYLDGGLSANSIKNRRNSPQYSTLLYKELSEYANLPIRFKLKALINYWRFSFFVNKNFNEKINFIGNSPLTLFAYPIGLVMKLKDDISLRKNG